MPHAADYRGRAATEQPILDQLPASARTLQGIEAGAGAVGSAGLRGSSPGRRPGFSVGPHLRVGNMPNTSPRTFGILGTGMVCGGLPAPSCPFWPLVAYDEAET